MFEMFRGGKPDPITLMAIEYEEHKEYLDRIANFIRSHYNGTVVIDIEDLAAEMGININLTYEDIAYIERKIR